jgi:hypothetical protein
MSGISGSSRMKSSSGSGITSTEVEVEAAARGAPAAAAAFAFRETVFLLETSIMWGIRKEKLSRIHLKRHKLKDILYKQ